MQMEIVIPVGSLVVRRGGYLGTFSYNTHIQEGDLIVLLFFHSKLDRITLGVEVF